MTKEPPQRHRRYSIGASGFEADSLGPGLYIVATPIGNLGDMTLRGLATLAAADAVLCEDTRITARLLERYAIRVPLSPYHEHNAAKVRPGILARLKDGACIALVSDAGMPLVSDPGYRLVREAIAEGIPVTACPGPSAVLTGLALSGLPSDRFAFFGFMPQKSGERKRLLGEIAALRATLVFFDSPHRICDTAVKGEITLLLGPAEAEAQAPREEDLAAAIAEALKTHSASRAAAEIARRHGLSKKEIYDRILALKPDA